MKPNPIGITLPPQAVKALANGATALLFVIEGKALKIWKNSRNSPEAIIENGIVIEGGFHLSKYLHNFSPLQAGDSFKVNDIDYDVVSTEVKRVQELNAHEMVSLGCDMFESFISWYNKQYGENAYELNPYIFYVKRG